MIHKNVTNKYGKTMSYRYFESISDLKHYIDTSNVRSIFRKSSEDRSWDYINFTGTKCYEEAEELLLHGWDYMAGKLTNALKTVNTGVKQRNKNVYSVAGYQACVPRYLQGIPDSMIYNKRIPVKDKVITINKNCGYRAIVQTNEIQRESEKCLKTVMELENKGYRVTLNIIYVTNIGMKTNIVVINIKKPTQRLNIKQVAFPMVHPSMLRRIIFKLRERSEEFEDYGKSMNDIELLHGVKELKGTYFLPNIVAEQEITNIEKYKVE